MNEKFDLIKDYNDCVKYLQNIDLYNYNELINWANHTFSNWMSKDKRYALSVTGGTIPPKNIKEEAQNLLTNLKFTLEKIAKINALDVENQ